MQKSVMMWTNRYSGEQGYVKSVSQSKGYFENTFDKTKAKKYTNTTMVQNDLTFLQSIGEMNNNEFTLVGLQ